jgi:hypothetical protein
MIHLVSGPVDEPGSWEPTAHAYEALEIVSLTLVPASRCSMPSSQPVLIGSRALDGLAHARVSVRHLSSEDASDSRVECLASEYRVASLMGRRAGRTGVSPKQHGLIVGSRPSHLVGHVPIMHVPSSLHVRPLCGISDSPVYASYNLC